MSTLYAFVLLLGVLIFVHELGHFLVAKACGVRVLKFSLGFGPPVGIGRYRLRWLRGHTEYVVAWFPLGGFVKMLGEVPDELDNALARAHPDETLEAKPVWQKLAVVFAGPAMNLILPVFIFVGMLWVGMPRPAPVVGMLEIGSPAMQAGLAEGSRITAIDGEPVRWWGEIDERIRNSPGVTLRISAERNGVPATFAVPVGTRAGFDEFGTVTSVGWAGMGHARLSALLGVPDAASAAARAGLRSGDLVTAADGEPTVDWHEFAAAIETAGSARGVRVTLTRGEPGTEVEATLPPAASAAALGIVPANVLVAAVEPDSPAAKAGFETGDLILAVDDAPVRSFESFAERVRSGGGETLHLVYARAGEVHRAEVTPELIATDVGLGIEEPRYRIGIGGAEALREGATGIERARNPLVAFPRAIGLTVDLTQSFLVGLGKMLSGEVSSENLAGPIRIAEIAGKAFERGWATYLSIMMLISINLGILNLLPIPILDGGQAVLFIAEGVKRSPLSLRTREVAQQIGLTLLLMLMGLAFWNDLSRQWSTFVDWIRTGSGL